MEKSLVISSTILIFAIMILLFWILSLFPHPIHLSVTEIEHNEKSKSLQIISRIFIDDLELAIAREQNMESIDLFDSKKGELSDKFLMNYLKLHIKIFINGKIADINYIAYEIEEPAVLCYLEIEKIKKFKDIEVTNSVIHETHKDQSNIINVTYKGQVKSLRLMSEQPFGSLNFQLK